MVRVFANGPSDLDSIPGRVIPKTQGGCHCGVMVKAMDCRVIVSELTPVALLRSLLGKYPWERYEPPLSSQLWVK